MELLSTMRTQVVVTPEEDSETAIAGAGLPGIYKLVQFHFHWGARSGVGSEHVIDGHPYAMEMHLVHMNTKYGTPEEAYKHSDGLAVVAVLFKVSRFDNLALAPIVQALRRMNRKHSTRGKLWRAISFARLLPRDARRLQSPVNIDKYGVVHDLAMEPLHFEGHQVPLHKFVLNVNGLMLTLRASPSDQTNRTVRGGRLPGTFTFHSALFHWGSTSISGSEHRIDGAAYPMEASSSSSLQPFFT
ncbi:hypothetical protein HPB48_017902 [Haemaphysalis longicornis]|uniref:Carbonic anhydrase n=1 Tax=Haemaphysalis longicornis TaxID=44386 RepID=A0A9J6GR55_HAELO|nr:hypothetical protein HPB48_017902 [Haemaphysalis longicornis]